MTPPTPDAAWAWPMFDFSDPSHSGRSGVPVLPVGRQQRLRLDRVAQRGAGAVRLDRVHLGRRQTRRWPAPAGSPAAATGRSARSARSTPRPGSPRCPAPPPAPGARCARASESRSTSSRPTPSAQPGAVGGVRERLAPAVGGQAPLAGELDERARGRHHHHAAGQRHVALALPQRLHRQVQRDQRRRTGGVDRHRRAFQPERVRQPAGGDAGGVAGRPVPFGAVAPASGQSSAGSGSPGCSCRRTPRSGCPAATPGRCRPVRSLPAGLQQQPLLRVHRQRLARADPEEAGVEVGRVVEEAALAGVAGPGPIGVRVVEGVRGPTRGRPGTAPPRPRRRRPAPTGLPGCAPRRDTGRPSPRSRSARRPQPPTPPAAPAPAGVGRVGHAPRPSSCSRR